MEGIFLKLLNMSISASYLVLAVLVLRVAFKRAPKFITVILWALVAVRLICPFSIDSVLSLIPSAETVPADIIYAENPQITSGISPINTAVNNIILPSLTNNVSDSANPMQIVVFIASVIWIIGIAAMLLYAAISYFGIRKKTKEAIRLEDNIMMCDHISTPFILGIIKPRIFLPSGMNDADKEYVIAHERAHIRRRDHWWKPLGFLLLAVYWFNPVLWLGYIFLCHDIEHACDESVIKQMGEEIKKPYSYALINCSLNRRSIMACPLAFGEVNLKSRIRVVLNYKKPAFWVLIISVILSIAVAVCFLTNPAGMKITDLRDKADYSKLFNNVRGITVTTADYRHIVTDEEKIEEIIGILESVRLKNDPISQSRSEDRDKTNQISFGGNTLCFSKDFSEMWIYSGVKPTLSYEVMDANLAELAFLVKDSQSTTAVTGEFKGGSDVYGLSATIKNIALDNDKPYIEIEFKNETDKEYAFGERFDITYKVDGLYSSCEVENLFFNDIAYPIEPGKTRTHTYFLYDFDLSRDGSYRFETELSHKENGTADTVLCDLWIDFELKNQTEDEMRESSDVDTKQAQIKQLRKEYPQFFDLPTENGLELYVVVLKTNNIFPTSEYYHLYSGQNLGYEWAELEDAESVSQDEMKLILSTYTDIASSEINIIVKNHPLAPYPVEITDGYVANIRSALDIYNDAFDSYPHFKATVLEIYNNGTILVEAFEGEAIRNIATQFKLNVSEVYDGSDRPLKVEDKLRIAYMGVTAETSPAQIADVRTVVLIDED